MSDITTADPPGKPRGLPPMLRRPLQWMRANLFNSVFNTGLTLLFLYVFVRVIPPFLRWAVIDATWSAPNGRACRASGGACWAFIGEKGRFILFGRFDYLQQWRPALVIALFIMLILMTCNQRFWNRWLGVVWAASTVLIGVLMWGGVFGMDYVDTSLWGGLTLTLILAVYSMAMAFPLAILLALGRRSPLPGIKAICVCFIELVRGVPLITVLFMASVMLPLFMPPGFNVDKLLRAMVAFTLFAAAYLAEDIRGGLQAVPKGQFEAADALGLGYWRKTFSIVLPQALAIVIPPLVNSFIGIFKDTSLVVIVSLLDITLALQSALIDPDWRGFTFEGYLFISLIFFAFCYTMSRYSDRIEASLNKGRRR